MFWPGPPASRTTRYWQAVRAYAKPPVMRSKLAGLLTIDTAFLNLTWIDSPAPLPKVRNVAP